MNIAAGHSVRLGFEHIEMIESKDFRTFIRVYSLFKSERLSTTIKVTLHKTLIRSVITYASPAWDFAANTHLIKLLRLQNKVLRTTGNLPRRTAVRYWHTAFKIPYVYDYITKLSRHQAEVIQNHDNENVRNNGEGATESIRALNLAAVKHTTVQVTRLTL
jgi:hypothetical protein